MPDLLATAAELSLHLDDDLDETRAEHFLKLASGEVRAYTGNLFDFVEDDTIVLNGSGSRILLLPEAPVSAVSAVLEAYGRTGETTLTGPAAATPAYEWDEDGVLERVDGGLWIRRRRWYLVTYDHGFDVVPDEVKKIVLDSAGRSYENPDGFRQESLGGYSYTRAGEQSGVGLFTPETLLLDGYFVSTKMREGTASSGSGSGS